MVAYLLVLLRRLLIPSHRTEQYHNNNIHTRTLSLSALQINDDTSLDESCYFSADFVTIFLLSFTVSRTLHGHRASSGPFSIDTVRCTETERNDSTSTEGPHTDAHTHTQRNTLRNGVGVSPRIRFFERFVIRKVNRKGVRETKPLHNIARTD